MLELYPVPKSTLVKLAKSCVVWARQVALLGARCVDSKQPTDPLLATLAMMSSLTVAKFGLVPYGSNCLEAD